MYSHRAWNPYCVASYALLVTECCFCREMEGHIRTASISVNMALLIIDEQLVSSHPFAFLYMDELCLGSIAGTISKFVVWDMKTIFECTPKSLKQNQHDQPSYIYIFWVELETPPPYPISTQTAAALYHFRFGWVLKSSSWTLHLRSSTVLMVLLSLGKNDARLPLHTSKDFSFLFLRKITLLITFSQHILTAEP